MEFMLSQNINVYNELDNTTLAGLQTMGLFLYVWP